MTGRRISRRTVLSGLGAGAVAAAGCAGILDDEPTPVDEAEADGEFELEEAASGLAQPWGLAFVPDTSLLLVTELGGTLTLVDREDGTTETVPGTPAVFTGGQGGLLDVTLHPDFPDEPWLYLTYAGENADGETATHLGRGRFDPAEPTLDEFEEIHVVEPFVDSNGHFGSRVVFEDDALYMTTGDRQSKEFGPDHYSQDLSNELGAILRLEADGSVPADNPFVDEAGTVDSIYSYGHRNPQGLARHPETGDLWESEHGERDGDEINVIRAGENYGWPVASEACEYGTETPVGDSHDEREDVVAPVYVWECGTGGFPPAGMDFYDGDAFPDWRGDLFVGNLAGQALGHFTVADPGGETVVEELDPLLDGNGWRVRDVAVAPDTGHLYVAVDAADAPIVRPVPR